MEVQIDHGRIIPSDPTRLPVIGRALLTLIHSEIQKPDFNKIKPLLGILRTDINPTVWERKIRSEWDER